MAWREAAGELVTMRSQCQAVLARAGPGGGATAYSQEHSQGRAGAENK